MGSLLKAEGLVRVPAVVSLQGVLGPYSSFRNFFGALSPWDVLRSTRLVELPLGLGLLRQYADIRRGARQEARILGAVDAMLGGLARVLDVDHVVENHAAVGMCGLDDFLRRTQRRDDDRRPSL